MNIFKKLRKNNIQVSSKDPSNKLNTNESTSQTLQVELLNDNIIIFSNGIQKFFCMRDNTMTPVAFDSYQEQMMGTYFLKKGDSYALSYYRSSKRNYQLTDFLFSSFKNVHNSFLILQTIDNQTYIYFNQELTQIEKFEDYTIYRTNNHVPDSFLLLYLTDRIDIYERRYADCYELMFTAKSIKLLLSNEEKQIFQLQSDQENYHCLTFYTDYFSGRYSLDDIPGPFSLLSTSDDVFYLVHENDETKYLFSTHENASNKYNEILVEQDLFLGKNKDLVEIIDKNFIILFSLPVTNSEKISLSYDKKNNRYHLQEDETVIYSLKREYGATITTFYSIHNIKENTKTLYLREDKKIIFSKDSFIKTLEWKCRKILFEFSNEYLLFDTFNSVFYQTKKQLPISQLGNYDNTLIFEYIEKISMYNKDSQEWIFLEDSIFPILKKCHITELKTFSMAPLKMNAWSNIGTLTITKNQILVKLSYSNKEILVTPSEIKTNLQDYLFDALKDDPFALALLEYDIKKSSN